MEISNERMSKLMDILCILRQADGVPPSYTEIAEMSGIKSTDSIHKMIGQLVELGLVEKEPGARRAIRVTDKGGELNPEYVFVPRVHQTS